MIARMMEEVLAVKNTNKEDVSMNLHIAFQPLFALIAGILILVMPKFLNYIVAAYLIIYGLVGIVR